MPNINGKKGAYQQPMEVGEDGSGLYQVIRWEGTASEIEQLIPAVRQMRAQWSLKKGYSGAMDMLEARVPAPQISVTIPEVPVDDWEFFSEPQEKDFTHANIAAISSLTENEKAGIQQYAKDPGPDSVPARTPGSMLDKLFKLLQEGVTSVLVDVPTLRHTQTVSYLWQTKASLTNVRRILSTDTLISLESVPVDFLLNLPSEISTKTDLGLVYGWLKKFPTIRQSANNRRQIEQEWIYGLWSTDLYGALL